MFCDASVTRCFKNPNNKDGRGDIRAWWKRLEKRVLFSKIQKKRRTYSLKQAIGCPWHGVALRPSQSCHIIGQDITWTDNFYTVSNTSYEAPYVCFKVYRVVYPYYVNLYIQSTWIFTKIAKISFSSFLIHDIFLPCLNFV